MRYSLKPIVTEKSALNIQEGKYTFEVDLSINKISLKEILKDKYGVEVAAVNILNRQGKKRRRGRVEGRSSGKKIAIVSLKSGEIKEVKQLF